MTTNIWDRGPAPDICAAIARAASEEGVLDGGGAVLFHDLGLLRARLRSLKETFPASTTHAIAVKANPLVEVLRVAVDEGTGLEAASIEEVEIAFAAGCDPSRIVFDSPAKTPGEIRRALELGVTLNADNEDELRRIAKLRPPDSTSTVGVRLNPMVGTGRIPTTSVAGSTSKFGVPITEADTRVLPLLREHPWIRALHSHVGSQGCSLDQLIDAAVMMSDLRTRWNGLLGRPQLDVVDIGGGLPTSYQDDDVAISPIEYAAALREAVPALFADDVRLVTEFGRVVQAQCGWALARVEYVKDVGDDPIVVVHVGGDLLMRAVYQPEFWRHRLTLLGPDLMVADRDAVQPTTVAGPLCFGGDIVARGALLPSVAEGDQLVVHDVGAYTLSMWSRHCSRGLPLVIGYDEAASGDVEFSVLRKRETPADVVRFWSARP